MDASLNESNHKDIFMRVGDCTMSVQAYPLEDVLLVRDDAGSYGSNYLMPFTEIAFRAVQEVGQIGRKTRLMKTYGIHGLCCNSTSTRLFTVLTTPETMQLIALFRQLRQPTMTPSQHEERRSRGSDRRWK